MINFIPIFPLDIIVYPGEKLNLHIFEPRYKQLITECIGKKKPFGLPSISDRKPAEFGTLMEVTELVKEYDNGEMDVRTLGVRVFRILEVVKEIPDKLYHGAVVNYPDNDMTVGDTGVARLIVEEVRKYYSLLHLESGFLPEENKLISYDIAHLIGFTKDQKYELLSLFSEVQRLEYIRRHLKSVTPSAKELEIVRERIKMNGHFRNLPPGDLDI